MTAYVLEEQSDRHSPARAPRLIDGHDIIKAFGLEPGPELGRLLEAVREARAAGDISDRQQALDYVKQLITGPDSADADRPYQGEL